MRVRCESCGSIDLDKDGVCRYCGTKNIITASQISQVVGELKGEPLVQFRRAITERLSYEQVQELCMLVGVDHEELPGQTKTVKVRELIQHCMRRDKMADLRVACLKYYGIQS